LLRTTHSSSVRTRSDREHRGRAPRSSSIRRDLPAYPIHSSTRSDSLVRRRFLSQRRHSIHTTTGASRRRTQRR
jgi:hypothetical protein